jgi:tRNA(Ile)-lysidine synthase
MSDATKIEARIRAFVAERVPSLRGGAAGLPSSGAGATHIVLAASGGADSTALVALLCECGLVAPERAIVAHFDHRLRGDGAAARDRYVVEALCARYALALRLGAWDAPRAGEAAAREARYRFLAETAVEAGARAVATGHTEDDQLETIVMQTLRGAGPSGAAGMAPERAWPHAGAPEVAALLLLRPLLATPRAETRAYCAARGLAYVDDETNAAPHAARNRVRAMLAESLAETPEARTVILQGAETARAARATLEVAARRAVPVELADGVARVDRAAIARFPPELRAYVWRPAIKLLLGDTAGLTRVHYAMFSAAAAARTGATFTLPRGMLLTVDPDALLLSIGPLDAAVVWGEHALPFEGVLGGWRVRVRPAAGDRVEGETAVRVPEGGVLRGRLPGDRVFLGPGRGHRKLQDAYVDAKIPRRLRDAAPVLAARTDVLWTPLLPQRAPRDGEGTSFVVMATQA